MIYSFNKQVACEPIANRTVASEVKSAFAVVKNKVELVKLKVLFGTASELLVPVQVDPPIRPGDWIYIKGDQVNLEWAKNVYTVDGVQMIMVPMQAIQMVENG